MRLRLLCETAIIMVAVATLVGAPASASTSTLSAVYVDAAWSGLSVGTDPAGPATAVGTDAFATIQEAIDAVDAGGTVHVAAGTYPELITITKAVTLEGANAGVDPNDGTRSTESVIDASGGGGTDNGIVIYGNASDVTIDGFELTGISGHIDGGYESGAIIVKPGRSGSVPTSGDASTANQVENVTIENNVLEDLGSRGVLKDDFATFHGLHIVDNLFQNVGAGGDASAIKVQAGCDWSGCPRDRDLEIRGNVVDTTSDSGILLNDVDGATIADNEIGSVPVHGVNVGNTNGTVTGDTLIQGNTITDAGTGSGGDAAVRIKPGTYDGSVLVKGNTVKDSRTGVLVESGVAVTGDFEVTANSFSGNSADVENDATATLDATGNWWGSSSAPAAVANVTTEPWCLVGDCSAESDEAVLTSLSLSSGTLSPAFGSSTTSYTVSVDGATDSLTTSASASTGATVTGAGTTSLAAGDTTVTLTVTSADGTKTTTYTIAVRRAAASTGGETATTPASTTGTGTPSPPPTTTTPPPPGPGRSASAPATPSRSGSVAVVVGPSAPGGTSPAGPPVSVQVAWQPGTFATPVTVQVLPAPPAPDEVAAAGAPQPGPQGFEVGDTVVRVVVTDGSGAPVTQFAAPLVIRISAIGGDQVPAYSHDGASWTAIPELHRPDLPAGQADGYYANGDGSVDIYTRHATLFGAVTDVQAPAKVRLRGRVTRRFLRLHWSGSRDNVAVAGYVVSRNGRGYRATKRTHVALPLRPGRYVVRARDAAGNVGAASAVVTVVQARGATRALRVRSSARAS
jgi:hypothetical protein